MREILLGFDAVKRWTDIPDNYGSTFLLRDDIDSLVSADSRLCDPVVERGNEWIGMNTHFWENLEHLERHLPNGVPYILMAATWHLQAREISGMLGPHESTTYPAHRDLAWNLLGYDINDPGISGLSNCGY